MGKSDFLTPKAIANRIKAKGLQKLRWYCQLCQKQCRDENGFKCHQMSDSHRRQMDLFGMDANRVVDGFSEEFEEAFMEHLKRAHPFSRVLAKNVYNEFIGDKNHVHMNSTKWLTLTDFVKYLGREGKCKVEETEKGWWITLIQKDPMADIAEERKLKRTAAEKEEEDRVAAEIAAQVERARKLARTDDIEPAGPDALVKTDDAPLVLSLAPSAGAQAAEHGGAGPSGGAGGAGPSGTTGVRGPAGLPPRAPGGGLRKVSAFGPGDEDEEDLAGPGSSSGRGPGQGSSKGPSKLDELMRKELDAKARAAAQAPGGLGGSRVGAGGGKEVPWVVPGIVVKVMSKELEKHGMYKKKGVVERVIDRFVGEVCITDTGDVVRVDQAQLETVIPQPGGSVCVVRGPHTGCTGTLREINVDKYQALVRLSEGPSKGSEVWCDYEDVSKRAKQ